MPRYQRVVVKMSGGDFAGSNDWGFDRDAIDALAGEIIALAGAGVQVGVMVGGGNIFRGASPISGTSTVSRPTTLA